MDETTLTLFYFNLRGRTPAPSGQFADESSTTGSPMWSHRIGQPVGLQKRFSAVSVLEPNVHRDMSGISDDEEREYAIMSPPKGNRRVQVRVRDMLSLSNAASAPQLSRPLDRQA